MTRAPLAAAVDAALAAPEGESLAARFAVPAITAILAWAEAAPEELAAVLERVIRALTAAGVPRGRQFVLLLAAEPAAEVAHATPLREALGVPVLLHSPRGATFRAGVFADGTPLLLDDELREAEAVVLVGPLAHAPALLWPLAADAGARERWQQVQAVAGPAGALALSAEAEAMFPADLVLWWDAGGAVRAGGFGALRAHAAARLAPHRDAR